MQMQSVKVKSAEEETIIGICVYQLQTTWVDDTELFKVALRIGLDSKFEHCQGLRHLHCSQASGIEQLIGHGLHEEGGLSSCRQALLFFGS